MPRPLRVILADYPHHVGHRGHNRAVLFASDADFEKYLAHLRDCRNLFRCKIYSFCLMTNHIHLVIDPGKTPVNLSLFMKRVAGRYTRYRNVELGRTGTAWNGRFHSNPIQTDRYLLACSRYVELNPVRAGMVAHPSEYPWSSFHARTGGEQIDWLDEDPCYRELGSTKGERARNYKNMFDIPQPASEIEWIRQKVQTGSLIADERFVADIENQLGRKVNPRKRGKPRSAEPGRSGKGN